MDHPSHPTQIVGNLLLDLLPGRFQHVLLTTLAIVEVFFAEPEKGRRTE
jgi:hypothetical protein